MKTVYSRKKMVTKFEAFGYWVFIEYRIRLRTFDLVFYPRLGSSYGATQFYEKLVCRNADYLTLCGVIVKTVDEYAEGGKLTFGQILRNRISELTFNQAMAATTLGSPAHSSIVKG